MQFYIKSYEFEGFNKDLPNAKNSLEFSSDKVLLCFLKRTNNDAIQYVYKRYWPIALRIVKENSGSYAEAEDLYHEAILLFLQKVSKEEFVLTCKLQTYFYSICKNKWLYQLRKRGEFIDIDKVAELNYPCDEAEEIAELPTLDQIQEMINTLQDPERSLLTGFYYEGLSLEQLTIKLNFKSVNAAKQRKYRGKERLKMAFANFLNVS